MQAQLLKQKVAAQFGAAASVYDVKAKIQQRIAQDAIALVNDMLSNNAAVDLLDIGCGTGAAAQHLNCHRYTGLDLAEGMIDYAQEYHSRPGCRWRVGDAEDLPFEDSSFDFVYSCMALQWLSEPETFAEHCYRVLRRHGEGLLVILTDNSLEQISHSWKTVTGHARGNTFPMPEQICKSLTNMGFQVNYRTQEYNSWHQNLNQVLHSIKDIGAGICTRSEQFAPLSRKNLREIEQVYKTHFEGESGLPLTYQVTFFNLTKG